MDYRKKLSHTELPSQIKRAGSPFEGRSNQLHSMPFQLSSIAKLASGTAGEQTKLPDLSLTTIRRDNAIDISEPHGMEEDRTGDLNPPSQFDDSDYFMSLARLLASRKISFGAIKRRWSYFIPMEGNMWRESRGPLVTYTREGVRRLGERFEELMEAKEMDRLGAGEQIMHNQMCIDVKLGDVEEMLGLLCSEEGELLHRIQVEYARVYGVLWKEQEAGAAREERLREELRNKEEDLERTKANAAQMLSEKCVKCEQVAELAGVKEGLGHQIRELKEQHEEAKQEMEKRYSEFNMLLQKIRDDERISKRTSGLAEQLQENDKIIRMRERKILELSQKFNAEVKELQEQLVAMKKAALIDVGIEKEKKQQTQQGWVESEDSEGAEAGAGSGTGLGEEN
ncbi:uncharacterized protein MONOS_2974 [Monocercomonoides exilis]|uniref:uncharacterized protein n=1 Tax=Monocercomonoides exilis TaxID=2049356 RepID=UPI0035599E6F|nr:hypothetical protein MONOS_2974 [Monocercomonoides exilis]|eukprot:MONOS_2974.1-p1 / transcript=MONOS_2974.1 / gene=MONOS_2974 / organism=Monocercomonoides_exilis_PA203 / gene_product=unspecified product / transcript_product=unspecified product / location=Mono_scaffold00065:134695-136052(+) / protein_length=397 / sequence_SO=supercontig / SO=protein_coding / is_pseudo=false